MIRTKTSSPLKPEFLFINDSSHVVGKCPRTSWYCALLCHCATGDKKNLMSKNPNPTEIPRFRISARRQTKTKLRGVETGLEEFFSKWCHVPGHETSEIRQDYSKSDVNVRNRT